jgi:hypothetical protein
MTKPMKTLLKTQDLMQSQNQLALPTTAELMAGWVERGYRMAVEARRTNDPRLQIMARNHLRGLQRRIAEAMQAE